MCWLYEDEASWREAAAVYLEEGARAGDQLLYIADKTRNELLNDLTGVASRNAMLTSGQLRVHPVAAVEGSTATFDPAGQAETFSREARAAVQAGYRGLRLAVEGTALASGQAGAHRFAGYELTVDGMLASSPLSALCGYDERRVGDEAAALCCVHPLRHATGVAALCSFYIDNGCWRLTGEVDMAVEPALRTALDAAAELSAGKLAIDLTGLDFIDIRGAQALVDLAQRLAPDRRLVLHHPPHLLTRLLEIGWGPVAGLEMTSS